MKKFLGLLVLILTLNGCDDGDIKVEALNFEGVTASSCGEVIYKIKGNEALFLKIPAALEAFKNEITPLDTPRIIPIGGDVVVRYRGYSGNVTSDNICPDVIQPISPVATVEWIAISGDIEITTTAVWSAPDAITGATRLVKYNHNIVFRKIIFAKPEGQQVYNPFVFGDYTTDAAVLPLAFNPESVALCPSGTTLYNAANGGIEGMYIQDIDPTLFSTALADLNVPKPRLISTTANKLAYRLFWVALTSGSNESYFCSAPFPTTPGVREEWIADPGVANVGIIEVTTTTNGLGYLHTIRLKGVTFRKGESTFYYGNDILFGELITN